MINLLIKISIFILKLKNKTKTKIHLPNKLIFTTRQYLINNNIF